MSGLNLRKRPRVCYYEPEEPPFDEYVYCAECGDYVYEYCSIHGPLLVIPDDKVVGAPPAGVPRAALTVPRVFLHLATSIIPGAGIGVFSSRALPGGVRFGPYRGARRPAAGDSDYGWQIFDKNHKPSHIVDAADDNRSNWMRYVNCARHCAEQNLVAYQYQGQLYYRTVKVIPRFSELLVFYGSEFARALGVDLRAYKTPCDCPFCQAIEQKTAPKKENKRQTKDEETILKVSPAEKIQKTSAPQVTLQNSCALPAPKKTKKISFKKVTKKSVIENVQNTLIDSQDNLQSDKTAFSAKEKCTEHSVHTEVNLPKNVVTIPSFKSKKRVIKTTEKSKKAETHFEVNLQKETVSSYNTSTKEATNKADLNVNPTNFKCNKCPKKFDIKSDLEKHLHTHTLIESNKTINKDFICKNCRNTFNTKFLLIEHRKSQHGVHYFACTECDYKTDGKGILIIHQRTHSSETPFKCDLCSFVNKNKSHLSRHLKTHTGEKPFNCHLCSYTSITKSNLVNHQKTHTGEKPLKCDLCSYACIQKSNFVSHQKTHTGEKPFKCDLCSYTCIHKSNLVSHQKTHTGEKPFKCDICDYRTTNTSYLKVHLMRIHSGQKPFSCDVCSYKCAVKADLKNHLKKHK